MLDKCPCNNEVDYEKCCKPFLKRIEKAPSPEKLMRSRYSAYVKGEIDYLIETTRPQNRDLYKREDLINWSNNSIWEKLEIISIRSGNESSTSGLVEFKAYYTQNGKKEIHHELSIFKKENDIWYFDYGTTPREIGKNEYCICGSGKKYKKCCGSFNHT